MIYKLLDLIGLLVPIFVAVMLQSGLSLYLALVGGVSFVLHVLRVKKVRDIVNLKKDFELTNHFRCYAILNWPPNSPGKKIYSGAYIIFGLGKAILVTSDFELDFSKAVFVSEKKGILWQDRILRLDFVNAQNETIHLRFEGLSNDIELLQKSLSFHHSK